MSSEEIKKIRKNVQTQKPLIHAITNPISINQCANAVLAVGARPMMAEHPKEAAEITATAQALLLNLGNITDVRMESMRLSAQTTAEKQIPLVIDLVGIACSKLRKSFAQELIHSCRPTVIKGNYSEILALCHAAYTSSGVDAEQGLEIKALDTAAIRLAKELGCTVLASGKTDVICDGVLLIHVHNGTAQLSRVTGTGCMLGVLTACYLTAATDIRAAMTACSMLGICGELAETAQGNGSFMVRLMDKLSTLSDGELEKHLKMEVTSIEATEYTTVLHH